MRLLPVALAACTTTSSSDLATADILPSFTVTVDDNGVLTANATFQAEPEEGALATYVDLADGDVLTLHLGDVAVPFAEVTATNTATGNETFATYAAAGAWTGGEGEVTIGLDRADGDPAPTSTVPIPADFALASLPDTFPVANDLAVTWSPTGGDPVDAEASGDCISGFDDTDMEDAGTWTLPAAHLDVDEVCDITVRIVRHRDGTLDPAFNPGGSAEGKQVRSGTTTLTQE
jgi:hypothetical protein